MLRWLQKIWVSIYSGDKITKNRANTQKYLHISQKSSTFALAFAIFFTFIRIALAIVAQVVEQRIRNAWVAGSSPASGSKTKEEGFALFFFLYTLKPTIKVSFNVIYNT